MVCFHAVAKFHAHLAFPNEFLDRRLVVAESCAKYFDGENLAGFPVYAAKDARERSGPDQILDPVVAVIEPGRLARHETIDLILREITVPLRRAKKFVGRKQF